MTTSQPSRTRSLIGVITAMCVVNLVYGITFPLLALVLDQQGISKTLIGLSTITQAVAVIVIAPLAPRMLARFEPARVMQVSAVSLAVLFILAGLRQDVYFWFPLRFVIGAFTAMLWISSEALINELSTERWRGRVIGIYSAAGAAGFALGPLLLIATGSVGMRPFYATTIIVLVSALPLFLVQRSTSPTVDGPATGLWAVFRLAPVIMLANVIYAASMESMITFFPLFGMHLGLSEAYALSLMTVTAVGGMVLLLPLGWLADHVNRMAMLAFSLTFTFLGFIVMPFVVGSEVWAAVAFFFVFGGFEGMIYSVGVTLVGQRFKGQALAAATTAFTTCWAVGTIIGPLLSGVGMDLFGAGSLAWIAAGMFLFFLPFPFAAWLRERRLPDVMEAELN